MIWCCSRPQTVQWLAQWTKSAPKARSHILAIQDDNLNMQMCIERNYFIGKFEKESYFASYYRTKQMFIILNWSITWDLRRKIKKNYNSSNIFKEKKIEAQWAEPVSLTFHSALRKLYFELSIYASYQIAVHLATQIQRGRFFRNRPIRNKNCLWWPYSF